MRADGPPNLIKNMSMIDVEIPKICEEEDDCEVKISEVSKKRIYKIDVYRDEEETSTKINIFVQDITHIVQM
jgi:hypothetical protein